VTNTLTTPSVTPAPATIRRTPFGDVRDRELAVGPQAQQPRGQRHY
jgi:hypothetical protein